MKLDMDLPYLRQIIKELEESYASNPNPVDRAVLARLRAEERSIVNQRLLVYGVIAAFIFCVVLFSVYREKLVQLGICKYTAWEQAQKDGAAYYFDWERKRRCTETNGYAYIFVERHGGHKQVQCLRTKKIVYDYTAVAMAQENKRIEREGAKFYYKEYMCTRTVHNDGSDNHLVYKVEKETGRPYQVMKKGDSYSIMYLTEEPTCYNLHMESRLKTLTDDNGKAIWKCDKEGKVIRFTQKDPMFKEYADSYDAIGRWKRLNKEFEWKGWTVF